MHVSGLFIYPVKSLRGCAVASAAVDQLGLIGDRRFLVVDESGRFLTQRVLPKMARIATALTDNQLTLSTEGTAPVSVPLQAAAGSTPLLSVNIWKSEGLKAQDCGDDVAAWLSERIEVRSRLVRIGPEFHRPVRKPAAQPGDLVAFNDAVPFLTISEASLEDLNRRITGTGHPPVPMDRFRTNIVISGAAPFAEDTWSRVRMGEVVLRAAGPCGRCIMTTTDQLTGDRAGAEPLRTLATYRRDAEDPTDVNFGQNMIHETKSGSIRVGDRVEPL